MNVSIIAALDSKGGIGRDNRLPWHISTDLRRFKRLTMGHHLIAGRKTYESIGRALPGRRMIVVTRNPHYSAEGCQVVLSLTEALAFAEASGEDEVFIIGGSEIFQQALDIVDRLYLTFVQAKVDADVYFPDIDFSTWKQVDVSQHDAGDGDEYATTYKKLIRVDGL